MGNRRIKKDTLKKIIIIGGAAVAAIAVAVAIIIVPGAIISSRFEKIFSVAEDMAEPTIVITNMGAENNYSDGSGEILVEGSAARFMIDELSDVADDFEYVGNEKAAGSFDLRYKISDEKTELEVYLSETGIYYVRNGKKYVFEPEDSEAKVEFTKIYNSACLFVK